MWSTDSRAEIFFPWGLLQFPNNSEPHTIRGTVLQDQSSLLGIHILLYRPWYCKFLVHVYTCIFLVTQFTSNLKGIYDPKKLIAPLYVTKLTKWHMQNKEVFRCVKENEEAIYVLVWKGPQIHYWVEEKWVQNQIQNREHSILPLIPKRGHQSMKWHGENTRE